MTARHVFRPFRSLTLATLTGLLVLAACRLESPPTPSPPAAEGVPTSGSTEVITRASAAFPPPSVEPGPSGSSPEPPAAQGPIPAPIESVDPEPSPIPEPVPAQEAPSEQQVQEAVELQRLLEEIQEEVRRQESVLQELSQQFEANAASFERLRILREQLDAVARASLGAQFDSAAVQQDRVVEQERVAGERERLGRLLLELAGRHQTASDSARMSLVRQQARVTDSVRTLRIIMYDSARARQARVADSVRTLRIIMYDSARARQTRVADSVRAMQSREIAMLGRGAGSDVSGRVVGPDGTTPLSGVSVTVSAAEFQAGVVTLGGIPNGIGRFILRGVPPGQRVLVLQHPDHGRWEVEMEVVEGEATNVGDLIAPGG